MPVVNTKSDLAYLLNALPDIVQASVPRLESLLNILLRAGDIILQLGDDMLRRRASK